MTEQIVDIVEANMPVSSDVEAAAKGAGAAAGEYAGRQAANASLADVRALADTNKSRLDTLTAAPASGNTELVDVRVGCDGKTYPTAGDAVRAQIGSCVRERGLIRGSNPEPPYDDLDTLPNASIVTYARFPNVAHAPADVTGGPWSPIPGHLQEIPAPCRSSYHRMAIWRTVSNGSTLRYGRIGRCSARRTDTIRPLHTPVSPPTDASA